MNTDQQLLIQAYLDNELPAAEARKVASLISTDLEAQELYRELKDTREIVVANEMPLRLQEPRDFYWSQIQRRIGAEESRAPRSKPVLSWWQRLVVPFAGAAALVALVATMLQKDAGKIAAVNAGKTSGPPRAVAETQPALNLENSADDMSTITFRSETEGVTVVWISAKDE
jgi:anti-sigma factor RsiW